MIVVLVSVLVYAISFLLLRALSRYREFAADRGSAVLTGRPSALASALMKISGTIERVPSQDLRRAEGMSAFFIVPPRTKKSLMNLFADHPPLEQRLAALERLESQLPGRRLNSGPARHPHGPPRGQGPGARPAVRDHHRLRHAREPRTRSTPPGPPRSSSRRSRRASSKRRSRTWRRWSRRPAATAARPSRPRTTATATAGWCCATPTAPRASKTSPSASTPCRARSRRPATASACCARCSPSPTRRSGAIYFIYNYKRGSWYPFVPARGTATAGAALDRARAAAQGADRRRTADRARARALVPALGNPDLSESR